MDEIIVGIDIGGSHLTSAITDLEAGAVVTNTQNRGQVDSHGSADAIIHQWSETINRTLEGCPRENIRLGIAMPGPFQYKEGISEIRNQNKYDALYGLNVKELLAMALNIPVHNIEFLNDAECFLRGEVFCGPVKNYTRAMGLTLGTGLGTAWYRDGKANDAALWCYPFRDGIAEDYCSTRWFIKRYHELTGETVRNVRELAERAERDGTVARVFHEFADNLASFLAAVAPEHQPQAVVIGGNIAKAFALFAPALTESLVERGMPIDIHKSQLGEEAALIGAASIWDVKIPLK